MTFNNSISKTAGTGYTWTAGTTRTDAGSQNVTATLDSTTPYIWSDNTTGTKTISCSIGKAALTITADNKTMTYGGSAPSYSYTVSGLKGTDTQANVVTGTATYTIKSGSTTVTVGSTTNVGTYSIVPSGLTIGSNYSANYAAGTLTVNKKSLTPSVTASDKTYDGTTSATCNVTLSGIVSGDTVTANATGTFSDADVGTGKTVTCSGIALSGTSKDNYSLSTTSKTTTANITAKSIAVTWGTTTSFGYDGSSHAPTVTTPVTGVSGESIALSVSGAGTNAGSYTATASCSSVTGGRAKCSNYTLSSNTKAFTITAKGITVTASNQNKTYDGSALSADTTCSVTSGSLLSGHTLVCTSTGSQTAAGSSTKTLSTVKVMNGTTEVTSSYTITKGNGTLTVNKKS